MDRRDIPFPAGAIPPCQCCGRRTVDINAVEPIGVLEGLDGRPPLILYQCECNSTRAIPWAQASKELKEKARKAKKDPANPLK